MIRLTRALANLKKRPSFQRSITHHQLVHQEWKSRWVSLRSVKGGEGHSVESVARWTMHTLRLCRLTRLHLYRLSSLVDPSQRRGLVVTPGPRSTTVEFTTASPLSGLVQTAIRNMDFDLIPVRCELRGYSLKSSTRRLCGVGDSARGVSAQSTKVSERAHARGSPHSASEVEEGSTPLD